MWNAGLVYTKDADFFLDFTVTDRLIFLIGNFNSPHQMVLGKQYVLHACVLNSFLEGHSAPIQMIIPEIWDS